MLSIAPQKVFKLYRNFDASHIFFFFPFWQAVSVTIVGLREFMVNDYINTSVIT